MIHFAHVIFVHGIVIHYYEKLIPVYIILKLSHLFVFVKYNDKINYVLLGLHYVCLSII